MGFCGATRWTQYHWYKYAPKTGAQSIPINELGKGVKYISNRWVEWVVDCGFGVFFDFCNSANELWDLVINRSPRECKSPHYEADRVTPPVRLKSYVIMKWSRHPWNPPPKRRICQKLSFCNHQNVLFRHFISFGKRKLVFVILPRGCFLSNLTERNHLHFIILHLHPRNSHPPIYSNHLDFLVLIRK